MRILFDSQQLQFKAPFGPLAAGQGCRLHIHIPTEIQTTAVRCVFYKDKEDTPALEVPFDLHSRKGAYDIWTTQFHLHTPALYFYHFVITTKTGQFRLFKVGHDTNMEAGDCWQLTCYPGDFTTPDWAKGAVFYQIFPDRFARSGCCDLTGKLRPYTVHNSWYEEVSWEPTPEGLVLNNDFFGGNFRGIREKLPYLSGMGVGILYLNPISKSFSSHRYDTGDYKTPDPMLGTTEDFAALCRDAHNLGIRVILDGVFSHTGSNSLYFNKEGAFGDGGAYRDPQSPYRSWYTFTQYPEDYHSWWNFDTLPTVNKMDPAFTEYIITGEDSVLAHWLRLGADGFRLDVADELPNEFMDLLKKRLRALKPDALLLGEVWEDASNKEAYDVRRRYFVDGTLDSVMNYPYRNAILDYLWDRDQGCGLKERVMTIAENYPPQVVLCNMNHLGTHDTPRILTALVDSREGTREELAQRKLTPHQRERGLKKLQMASFLQYMLPGAPSLYYGDEAGMEGGKDPFNRRTYPWGKQNKPLLEHYRRLGQLRKELEPLRLGDIQFFKAQDRCVGFTRSYGGRTLRICVNRSGSSWEIPSGRVLYGRGLDTISTEHLVLGPMGWCLTEDL